MKIVRRRVSNFIEDEDVKHLNREEIMQIFLALSFQKEFSEECVIYVEYHRDMKAGKVIKLEASIRDGSFAGFYPDSYQPIVKIMERYENNESGWIWRTSIGPNFLKTFSSELKQIVRNRKLNELGL